MIIEGVCLLVALNLALAWIQDDPRLWPRRVTHCVVEPLLKLTRKVSDLLPSGSIDLSPLVLILGLTGLKLVLT